MGSATLFQQLCLNPDDEGIWRKLVDYYTPWVLGWATRVTRRHDVAEDITSTVFLKIYQNLERLRQNTQGSLRSWIGTTVHHLLVDWKRNERRRPRDLTDEDIDNLVTQANDLEEHLDRAELCERYALAWEVMSAQSKMTAITVLSFLLRVRGKLSSEQVKIELQLESSQAVNTNVKRVRDYLAIEVNLPKEHARWIDHLDGI